MGFVVHARLGRGRVVETFSATLQIQQERLGVVVKRPRPTYAQNGALAQALTEWGEAQTDVDHPHVVAVLEAGQTKDGAYVIQERVDGVPLAALLRVLRKKRRTINPDFALVMATRLADALENLSVDGRPGHGSLDAGDVLLSYDGEVKLGDQGLHRLAKVVGVKLVDDTDNVYWPPEVLAGATPDPRSDVFALGLLILEMMIGHPVWTAQSMSVRDAIEAVSDFTYLGQASPALTRALLDILRPCLEENPLHRPTTAGSVYRAFIDLLEANRIRPDDAALGRFVRAVLPPAEEGEAPTMMVDPEEAERLLEVRRGNAEWDVASVMINPEIEARARSAVVRGRVLQGATPPPPEPPVAPSTLPPRPASLLPRRPTASGAGAVQLVAEVVDLDAASPEDLRRVAADARRASSVFGTPRSAPAPAAFLPTPSRRPARISAPRAPSALKELVERLSNVGEVASVAYQAFERSRSRIAIGLIAVIFVLALGLMFAVGGNSPEVMATVRLRASSEPDHARLWVDGDLIGQTPIDVPVPQKDEPYRLRFELQGYRTHEVTIGSSEDELRYEAVLRPVR